MMAVTEVFLFILAQFEASRVVALLAVGLVVN